MRLTKRGTSIRSLRKATQTIQICSSAIITKSTLRHCEAKKQLLSSTETERLIRLVRVYIEARSLFDDANAASDWLNTAADFLDDGQPVTTYELAASEAGARWVKTLIRRTAHGFVA